MGGVTYTLPTRGQGAVDEFELFIMGYAFVLYYLDEAYTRLLSGYELNSGRIISLNKSMYGLKQNAG